MSSRVGEQLEDTKTAEHDMVTAGNGLTSKEEKAGDGHDASEEVLKSLLRDEEAFKKELTKRRIHRGKIRGRIRVLQESMELLIIPEGQETTEELQSLEVQEDLLHDQLRRAEEEIEDLQQRRAEVVSKTAKEQARSVASRSVRTVGGIRDGNASVKDFHSLTSGEEKVDEDNNKQPCDPVEGSRKAQGEGESQRSFVLEPKASPRSSVERVVSNFHQGSDRGITQCRAREFHKSSIKAIGVSKLMLPDCEDVLDLDSHFEVVEGILRESGAGEYIKGEAGKRQFVLREEMKMSCVGKLLTTLPAGKVRDSAKRAARRSKYTWERVKQQLRCRFCKKSTIVSNIEESLNKLTYGGPGKVDLFLEIAEDIVLRCVDSHKDNSETYRVIRAIVRAMPGSIAGDVITEIKREARAKAGSYRAVCEESWETLLPFSEEVQLDPDEEGITISDIIRDVSRTSEDTQRREADRVAYVSQPNQEPSKGGKGYGGQSFSRTSGTSSLESWAKGFKTALVITARNFEERDVTENFQPDGWKILRSKGKGQGQRYGRPIGAVVGYNDADKGKEVMAKIGGDSQMKEKFRVRPFNFKEQGNDKGRM